MKVVALLALTLVLLLGAIAIGVGFPPASVQAQAAAASCPETSVALDEGYGVSRTVMRPVCAVRH